MRKFYFKAREDVFMDPRGGIKFDSNGLERMLEDMFGDMKMKDIEHPRVVVTATWKETMNLKLHLFSNIFEDVRRNELVRKVARYTSAAPMCFPEIDNYVDGGILAQNPSLTVLTAIQRHFNDKRQKLPISLVVSIGSGRVSDNHAHIGNVDATEFLCFGKHWFKAVRGLTERIKNLLALLSNAISESEIVSENCRFHCEEQGIAYYRLNPTISEVIPPGDTNLYELVDMMMTARRHTVEIMDFNKLVNSLEKVEECRNCLPTSYSEKLEKLKTMYKTELM